MKRTVIALTVTALAAGGAGVASAKPANSNGAQKAGLAAATGNSVTGCSPANGAGKQTATGFAVLNAPGKPGSPKKVVGEVAVKDAEPGTYDLRLVAPGSSSCGDVIGTLTVGPNRQGNASVAGPAKGAGSYYVVLTQPAAALVAQERYASAPVTLR